VGRLWQAEHFSAEQRPSGRHCRRPGRRVGGHARRRGQSPAGGDSSGAKRAVRDIVDSSSCSSVIVGHKDGICGVVSCPSRAMKQGTPTGHAFPS